MENKTIFNYGDITLCWGREFVMVGFTRGFKSEFRNTQNYSDILKVPNGMAMPITRNDVGAYETYIKETSLLNNSVMNMKSQQTFTDVKGKKYTLVMVDGAKIYFNDFGNTSARASYSAKIGFVKEIL